MKHVTLYVATEKGGFVYTSDEGREHWDLHGPLLKGWKLYDLQLDERTDPATLWAAVGHIVYGPSIHRSTDGGKTWQQIEHGPKYADDAPGKLNAVWTVTPGRASEPEVVYAGVADAGLFVSRDGGNYWDELTGLSRHETREDWQPGAGGLCCHTILLHPENKDRMWVGISAVGVFRSDDGGRTWTIKNEGLERVLESKTHKEVGSCIHRLSLDPRNPDRLFQQNHRGVFRSTNAGDTWERIENGLPSTFGFPIAMDPNDSDTLFVVPMESDEYRYVIDGELQVYRTTDGGDSWQPMQNGLPANNYVGVLRQAMATDACDPCGIYFGTSAGELFYSRDRGESWQALPGRLPRISSVSAAVSE